MNNTIAQGAEAILTKRNGIVTKSRIKKSYRLPFLDNKLRKQRTRKESKLLDKASGLINVPKILEVSDYSINMEFINGKNLSESLDSLKNAVNVCKIMGKDIAKLHDANIIHGDLTTSNILMKKNKLYFVDFGLGFESSKPEDKAVDLHVLKESLEACHFKHAILFYKNVLKGYKYSKNYEVITKRLEKVEARGRYKQAY